MTTPASVRAAGLPGLLRQRADAFPNRRVYTWLTDGRTEGRSLDFRQLDARARAIAAHLVDAAETQDRALLLYRPGLEFIEAFLGCLYAGIIAVPAYAVHNSRQSRRIESIGEDAQATIALTTADCLDRHKRLRLPFVKQWVATDTVETQASSTSMDLAARGAEIAYLQYTSGSTATPKGVMITHASLIENLAYIAAAGDFDDDSKAVSWLPHFHDMGLVYGWLQPIYGGYRAYHMAPASFTLNPLRWLQAIATYGGTHCGGPNFAFDLCTDRVRPDDRNGLDLASWRVAFTGAEPIQPDSIERFVEYFRPCGFKRSAIYPVYGLAEATLKATSVEPGTGPQFCSVDREELSRGKFRRVEASSTTSQNLVSCGVTSGDHTIEIVDPVTQKRTEPGRTGEIWFSGPSVGGGYWNRSAETKDTFHAAIQGDLSNRRYLRTGDIGVKDAANLFVVGRLKETIIIRGRNYYPQDIEHTVESSTHGVPRGAAVAFGVEAADSERLVVAAETLCTGQREFEELVAAIQQCVAEEYEVQVYAIELLRPGSIDRTSSGKRQRNSTRAKFLEESLPSLFQWRASLAKPEMRSQRGFDRTEFLALAGEQRIEFLANYLRTELANLLNVAEERVMLSSTPSSLGVDSLVITELAHRIERDLELDTAPLVPVSESIYRSAARLDALIANGFEKLPEPRSDGRRTEYPLSSGQQALWFLQNMRPLSTAWNITRGVSIRGALDESRFCKAVVQTVSNHSVLRTTFHETAGVPFQRVHEPAAATWFESVDISDWSDDRTNAALAAFAEQPFCLNEHPPVRIALWKQSEHKHLLLLSIHHIISDFWSLRILWKEIFDSYAGLPRTKRNGLEYVDYVDWQTRGFDSPEFESSLEFWERILAEPLPETTLVRDQSRVRGSDRIRGTRTRRLRASACEAARRLAAKRQTTMFTALVSATMAWMYRETGQSDVLIGTTVHGRPRQAFREILGYFANTLPIRAQLSGKQSLNEVIGVVSQAVAGAFEHSQVPFAVMVERSGNHRDASLSPIIHTLFVYHSAAPVADLAPLAATEGLAAFPLDVRESMTQFDVTVTVTEARDGALDVSFDYDSGQFHQDEMADSAARFETFLESSLMSPDEPIEDCALLSIAQRTRILRDWNRTSKAWDEASSLAELISGQANLTPEAVAVSFESNHLTYGCLDRRSRAVAASLCRAGDVGPESVIAVCCDRSTELMVALLGILYAGAAYLPLDPEHPAERLQYMRAQAAASLLLCQKEYAHRFEDFARVALIEDFFPGRETGDNTNFPLEVMPANIAYVIFTSGSTGRPKGVMISHEAICNRLLWMREHYGVTQGDVIVQKTPLTFDVSVWELFLPLISGAQLVFARPGGHRDPKYIADLVDRQQVTMLHFIPRMLLMAMEHSDLPRRGSIRNVICSGEALPADVESKFLAASQAAVHNLYGPTEAAVDVTAWHCIADDLPAGAPIGKPIANTRLHVLDENMHPVPPFRSGQLYIGGIGLARGYVGRPELTANSFVPDPCSLTAGERLYRTGDLAQYDLDGNIRYLGRIDTQVKIRGLRVEIGEIETTLRKQAGVIDSAVVVEALGGEDILVAYLVTGSGRQPNGRELRASLAQSLPDYMVPSRLISVPYLPLSPNGKLDRRALAGVPVFEVLSLQDVAAEDTRVTVTEHALLQIWSHLLGERVVNTAQNFFSLGGHSLLAMRMAAEIRESFGVELPLECVFAGEGTVASIAEVIEGITSGCTMAAGA